MAGIVPNNVIRIPCNNVRLFRYWLELLAPFHHLTDREIDVATAFLVEYENLKKVVLDKSLLDKTLMSEDVQKDIREKCGLASQNFKVIRSKLRTKKFLINDKINPKMIPNVKWDDDSFQLLLVFEYQK